MYQFSKILLEMLRLQMVCFIIKDDRGGLQLFVNICYSALRRRNGAWFCSRLRECLMQL